MRTKNHLTEIPKLSYTGSYLTLVFPLYRHHNVNKSSPDGIYLMEWSFGCVRALLIQTV